MSSDFELALCEVFGSARVGRGVVLARFTTLKVGGPADYFVEPRGAAQIVAALRIAHAAGVPVTVLGGGSNVLVGDRGIRGLVLRPTGGTIDFAGGGGRVRADAAVTLNGLVRWTIGHSLAGLEAWAGTPGSVGGAVYGNAHYAGRLIGDRIGHVTVARPDGTVAVLPRDEMEFGYDRSRLQRTAEILLDAVFGLEPGAEAAELREIARRSLAHRKSTQPLNMPSAGCMFQNPAPEDRVPDGIPASAGALVDRAGMKGMRVGGASVSEVHGNFIVNRGDATAADISELAGLCRKAVYERFGVDLREEIVRLGEF